MRYYLENWLFTSERGASLEALREEEREKIELGSTVGNRVSQDFLPIPFLFSGKVDFLQV